MNAKLKVPEVKDMPQEYYILAKLGMDETSIKRMWCLNELDQQSCNVNVVNN